MVAGDITRGHRRARLNTAATLCGSAAIGAYARAGLLADAAETAAVVLGIRLLLSLLLSQLNDLTRYFSVGVQECFTAAMQGPAARMGEARAAVVTGARHVGLHLPSLSTAALLQPRHQI